MTYNVRMFDLYNSNSLKEETQLRKQFFGLIRKEYPDILCLQEYYNGRKSSVNYADTIVRNGSDRYYYDAYIDNGKKMLPFGLTNVPAYLGAMMVQVIEVPSVPTRPNIGPIGPLSAVAACGARCFMPLAASISKVCLTTGT